MLQVLESLKSTSRAVQVVKLVPQTPSGDRVDRSFSTLRLYASHLDASALAKAGIDCEDCQPGPMMSRQPDLIAAADGSFTLHVQPGFMYTATSLPAPAATSATPGLAAARSPVFPLPLVTDFDTNAVDSIPRYFNNYEGSFSIAELNGERALKQWLFRPYLLQPIITWTCTILPFGMTGIYNSSDRTAELSLVFKMRGAGLWCGTLRTMSLWRSLHPATKTTCLAAACAWT